MSALSNDYDSDPGRFLSSEKHPHDDVHPYVAERFSAAGARTVLDVGGGNGKLARLLPGLSMRCLLIDLSPTMLSMAPRPSVRADGARLPVADASVDAVAALFTLYRALRRSAGSDPRGAAGAIARRAVRGLLGEPGQRPGIGARHPRLGGAFHLRRRGRGGDRGLGLRRSRRQGGGRPLGRTLSPPSRSPMRPCAGVYRLGEVAAADAAASLDLPLTLTNRGSVVYATKAR